MGQFVSGTIRRQHQPQRLPEVAASVWDSPYKRPKKRLLKADEDETEQPFVAEYATMMGGMPGGLGAQIFFADEAHFRADAELRGKWDPEGGASPGGVHQSQVRREGQLLLGGVFGDWRGGVDGAGREQQQRNVGSLLEQFRGRHDGRLNVIWDHAPAHRGEAVREYLRTPDLNLRLVNLPGYSPDFNADEAIWGWAREEATGNLCLGSRAMVQEKVGSFPGRADQPEG